MASRMRFSVSLVAALAAGALLAVPAADARAPIGSGGVIHACYKAKGKHKGAVRLVKSAKKCRRKKGERPIQWNALGQLGTNGTDGTDGTGGSTDVSSLLTRI